MKRVSLGAQGEISIFAVGDLPNGLVPFTDQDKLGRPIISHSENGNHHLLDASGITVMEKPDAPGGMRILYALLNEPTLLFQDAGDAHGEHILPAGVIEFRLAREYDPFSEQIHRVAD